MDAQVEEYRAEIRRLEALGMMPDRPPGLAVMREGLARLGLEIDPRRVVIIAGTNGKGSVAATLEALLLHAGARTGLYTSPHLIETTERVRVGGRDLTPAQFLAALRAVESRTQGMRLTLSHFEILTLVAVWVFHSGEDFPAADWAIYEVGLGGTWDATNAIPHDFSVITSLAMDHENLLGRTLWEVAENKFGIVSQACAAPLPGQRRPVASSEPGVASDPDPSLRSPIDGEPGRAPSSGSMPPQVVHTLYPSELETLAERVRGETRSEWYPSRSFSDLRVVSARGSHEAPRFKVRTPWGEADLSLPGRRGAENTLTALTAFERMGFDPTSHLAALAEVRWPGRMERIEGRAFTPAAVYLSGDHNPHGMQSLLELLPHYPRRHLHCLVGIGRDKDAENILAPLAALRDTSIYLTVTPFRGRELAEYGPWLERATGAWSDPREAFREIASLAQASDLVLVTGSLYLVGEIRALLLGIPMPTLV